ncbi:unnamed protein product [Notodromas monacha]|uniref:TAFII28-like protein domain-containing protein n=1 Tax=Notodromas monacha TaxID=399045 RepID=A0A7R9BUK3_9CRUS|nr:unnamed protein product [Notodromas monacha]CAG0920402.1 unnamed protein product [Notodromas monacha]
MDDITEPFNTPERNKDSGSESVDNGGDGREKSGRLPPNFSGSLDELVMLRLPQPLGAGAPGHSADEHHHHAKPARKILEEEEREKMQVLVSNFTEEQLDRYEMYRRSAFPKAAIRRPPHWYNHVDTAATLAPVKAAVDENGGITLEDLEATLGINARLILLIFLLRGGVVWCLESLNNHDAWLQLMQSMTGSNVSQNAVIAMSGLAKVYVGEVIEEALDVMEQWGESGPLQPKHLRESVRRLRRRGIGMGLTKQYLRFIPGQVLNLICHSSASNCTFVSVGKNAQSRYMAVAAAQNVIIWDLLTQNEVTTIYGENSEVTQLCNWRNDLKNYLCVGYNDGSINIYDLSSAEKNADELFSIGSPVLFKGHRSGITSFLFDDDGLILVSGGKDSDIVVWDLVKESGLFRLKGHKGPITGLKFFPGFRQLWKNADPDEKLDAVDERKLLASSGKDGMMKFWDLGTRHCCFTLAVPATEIYCFEFIGPSLTNRNAIRFLVGSAQTEVGVWEATEVDRSTRQSTMTNGATENLDDLENEGKWFRTERIGSIIRGTKGRTTFLSFMPSTRMLLVAGQDRKIEVFRVCAEAECKKRLKKRMKKAAERDGGVVEEVTLDGVGLVDQIVRRNEAAVTAQGRIKCFSAAEVVDKKAGNCIKVVCGLANNAIQSFLLNPEQASLKGSKSSGAVKTIGKIEKHGHRTDVRVLDYSSDSTGLMSASSEAVKIWVKNTDGLLAVARTIPCRYAVCGTFLPGDRHIVLGTKPGYVQLFDVAGGQMLEEISTAGFVTGGETKTVQIWELEYYSAEGSKRLSFLHKKSLVMEESILVVKYSPDGKFLAVACLDSSVKLFFADTLKFHLTLYGHKLPVLGLDISSDSRLIVTASSDRTIKIWGMDFGDCHKTLLGHADSVMAVKFLPPSTHHIFSASRDGKIKYWDADNFQLISTIKGNLGEIWALSTSPDGLQVASSSRDGSIRVWEKSQEIIVLQDEREEELAEDEKNDVEGDLARETMNATAAAGETNRESGLASFITLNGEEACARLIEAVKVVEEILPEWKKALRKANNGQKLTSVGFEPHPIMVALRTEEDPYGMLMETIARIPSSHVEECLTLLPYEYARMLIEMLQVVIRRWYWFGEKELERLDDKGCVRKRKFKNYVEYAEAVLRCLHFLTRIQHGRIFVDGELIRSTMCLLSADLNRWSDAANDMVGFNLAGLEALESQLRAAEEADIFEESFSRSSSKKKNRKRQRRLLEVQQAVMSLS